MLFLPIMLNLTKSSLSWGQYLFFFYNFFFFSFINFLFLLLWLILIIIIFPSDLLMLKLLTEFDFSESFYQSIPSYVSVCQMTFMMCHFFFYLYFDYVMIYLRRRNVLFAWISENEFHICLKCESLSIIYQASLVTKHVWVSQRYGGPCKD